MREGYKGWQLESAIGFEGFVIAKSISGKVLSSETLEEIGIFSEPSCIL